MICGHCKRSDAAITVAHVRACQMGQAPSKVDDVVRLQNPSLKDAMIDAGRPVNPALLDRVAPFIPVTEEGVYFNDGQYVKIVPSQDGHLYAKVWEDALGVWDYAPGRIKRVSATDRISAERAAQFGRITGKCVFCTRLLTDERSLEVGYGEVCAGHHGLPWG